MACGCCHASCLIWLWLAIGLLLASHNRPHLRSAQKANWIVHLVEGASTNRVLLHLDDHMATQGPESIGIEIDVLQWWDTVVDAAEQKEKLDKESKPKLESKPTGAV